MKDLEIRGAGNLLGAKQHGHMEAVGYDLYCKMLNEAEKAGRVISVTDDLPKTFVVTTPPGKKTAENRVYLCQLSTGTLKKRSRK